MVASVSPLQRSEEIVLRVPNKPQCWGFDHWSPCIRKEKFSDSGEESPLFLGLPEATDDLTVFGPQLPSVKTTISIFRRGLSPLERPPWLQEKFKGRSLPIFRSFNHHQNWWSLYETLYFSIIASASLLPSTSKTPKYPCVGWPAHSCTCN